MQQVGREVQPGRRRGGRPRRAGINSLVALRVVERLMDVGRQGRVAQNSTHSSTGALKRRTRSASAPDADDRGRYGRRFAGVVEQRSVSPRLDAAPAAKGRPTIRRRSRSSSSSSTRPPVGLRAKRRAGMHAGVVGDEDVTRPQIVDQVAEVVVGPARPCADRARAAGSASRGSTGRWAMSAGGRS
jgi:hypothetical protein